MKYIPNKEYRYGITEDGQIFSFTSKRSKWLYRILKPYKNKKTGYLTVNLIGDRAITIHRLVAMTYIPNPNNYPVVMHLDNNKLNNHYSNLKWGTHKENIQQAFRDGLCPTTEKQRYSCILKGLSSRKPIKQFTLNGEFVRTFISMREAYRITGVKEYNISKCVRGVRKQAGCFIWKYKEHNLYSDI